MRRPQFHVIEVLARNVRGWIFTYGQPYLRTVTFIQIVVSAGASHFGGDPARFESIGENIAPAARDAKRQQDIMKFRIGIGLLPPPWTMFPGEIVQVGSPL